MDEAFRRRGDGWCAISDSELVLVAPAFTAEKSVPIGRKGRAAASPDGTLLAVAGTDTLTVFDDGGDLVATVILRRWPDGSGSAVAFSVDGTCLLAVCAGDVRGTAEIRKIDGGAGWATTATATFPVTNNVYPGRWALPHQSGYLVSIGGTVVTADELLLWDHDGGLALAAGTEDWYRRCLNRTVGSRWYSRDCVMLGLGTFSRRCESVPPDVCLRLPAEL